MASILAPPPSTPPQHSTAPDGTPPNSRASSPVNENAMQVESVPPGSTSQAPPKSTNNRDDNSMEVDEPGTNATTTTEATLRRTTRNIKPFNYTLSMQPVVPVPPSGKSKGKQQKKTPSTMKSATPHPRPLVIGSKYMNFRFIDLTQVEVSTISLLYFGALHSSPPSSAHLLPWSSPELPWYITFPFYQVPFDSLFASNLTRQLYLTHTTHTDNRVSIRSIFMYVKPLSCRRPTKKSLLFQRTAERDTFIEWVNSITRHYHAGKPKHVSLIHKSYFTVIDRKTFSEMSPSRVQIQLQKGVIVIPDMDLPGYPFSRHGIHKLNSINTDVRIQGVYSISHYHHSLFWHITRSIIGTIGIN